jgi:hypothetical protein
MMRNSFGPILRSLLTTSPAQPSLSLSFRQFNFNFFPSIWACFHYVAVALCLVQAAIGKL